MNQVDIDCPFANNPSRLVIYCWGLFFGSMTSPHSLTFALVLQHAVVAVLVYWVTRSVGRFLRNRKQHRAC